MSDREFHKLTQVQQEHSFANIKIYKALKTFEGKRGQQFSFPISVVETNANGETSYFSISNMKLVNDSTIIIYSSPLKTTTDTAEWVNGTWFFAHFYDNSKEGSGVNYSVDSLPPSGVRTLTTPSEEGIYRYENRSIIRVAGDQSEESFYNLKKDGFYFLPNPGGFYIKMDIRKIGAGD